MYAKRAEDYKDASDYSKGLERSANKDLLLELQGASTLTDLLSMISTGDPENDNLDIIMQICKHTGGGVDVHIKMPKYLADTIQGTGLTPSMFLTMLAEEYLREKDMLDGGFPALPELVNPILALKSLRPGGGLYNQTSPIGITTVNRIAYRLFLKRFRGVMERRLAELTDMVKRAKKRLEAEAKRP